MCVCGCIGSQLHHAGSFIVVHRPSSYMACRLSCSIACGILVPQPGIEPASPALQSRFLTTGLPGKSSAMTIMENIQWWKGDGWGRGYRGLYPLYSRTVWERSLFCSQHRQGPTNAEETATQHRGKEPSNQREEQVQRKALGERRPGPQ